MSKLPDNSDTSWSLFSPSERTLLQSMARIVELAGRQSLKKFVQDGVSLVTKYLKTRESCSHSFTKTTIDKLAAELLSEELKREHALPLLWEDTAYEWLRGDFSGDFFVVDPIDGTSHIGVDVGWFVSLAYVQDNKPCLAAVSQPQTDTVFFGSRTQSFKVDAGGAVTYLSSGDDRPLTSLGVVSDTDLRGFAHIEDPELTREKYRAIARENGLTCVEVGSAEGGIAVLRGEIDSFVNLHGNFPWDTAALEVLLAGAGFICVPIDWSNSKEGTVEVPLQASSIPLGITDRDDRPRIKSEGYVIARPSSSPLSVSSQSRVEWRSFWEA